MSAAHAASVAARLLAFYREPTVYRPLYAHGQERMPDGQVVFRLALGRFPAGWLRELPAAERDEVRLAARAFVRQVCLRERATHYQLLCAGPDAGRGELKENYRLMMALIHPDRQDASLEAWPLGCAQRVNQAIEELTDPGRRAAYDAGLELATDGAALDAWARAHAEAGSPRHVRTRSRPGLADAGRRAMVIVGVLAALFVVQSWWVGGSAPEHSLLERSLPASARWMRDVLPDTPRFLAHTTAFDFAALAPLAEPRRLAAVGTWVPMSEPRVPVPPAAASPAPAPAPAPASMEEGLTLQASAAVAMPRDSAAAERVAPAEPKRAMPAAANAPAPAVQPPAPSRVAQAAPPGIPARASPDPGAPTRDQVEAVVALMVGYYDAGDAPGLVGLIDADSLGWWQGMRTRAAYADFFAATRERRLRMERLAWETAGTAARARGEAVILAQFADGRPAIERRVPVEVDIELRAGEPRITRLVLFPGA